MITKLGYAVAALVLAAGTAHGQFAGGDWGGGDWGDWDGDSGSWFDSVFGAAGDAHEDPSRHASAIDIDFEPDEILALNLRRESLAAVQRLGFRVRHRSLLKNLRLALYRLQPPRGMSTQQALAVLRKADPHGYYDRNTLYRLAGSVGASGPCAGLRCYGQQMIRWRETGCAVQARIGLLDTAIDLRHPALAGRRIRQQRLFSGSPGPGDSDHGTAVAALLVGSAASGFPGLLPEADLVAADVFASDRKGRLYTDAALMVRGLDWVAGYQPAVINLSIAGPDSGVLHTAIRRLVNSGTAIVAAAGNRGPDAPPQFPAAYPDVIAVTAVDRHRQVYALANRGSYVTLAAPGVSIWTAGAGKAGLFRDGTSFAAPFATAEAALLRARRPALAPAEIKARLRRHAQRLGRDDADPVFGAGLLQSQGCEI